MGAGNIYQSYNVVEIPMTYVKQSNVKQPTNKKLKAALYTFLFIVALASLLTAIVKYEVVAIITGVLMGLGLVYSIYWLIYKYLKEDEQKTA